MLSPTAEGMKAAFPPLCRICVSEKVNQSSQKGEDNRKKISGWLSQTSKAKFIREITPIPLS